MLTSGLSSPKVHDELWRTIRAGNIWRGELHDRRKNGEFFWVDSALTPIRDEAGTITHYLAVQEDITIRKQYEEQLVQQANYDKLTGLPNRLLGADRLTKALQRSKRNGTNAALLFIDLDGFKKINDSLGHGTGDRLLQETAQRLSQCVRATDTVARWGGDEFLVILPDMATPESAELVAEKVLEVCSGSYQLDGYDLSVTASIGISVFPLDGNDGTELMRNADAAMYAAKESGRNALRFFQPELNHRAIERLGLESDLRRALANHEFALHYQPVIAIETGDIVGAEALLRWRHPETGLIPPDKFIPIAEDTGLIVPIGEWVMRTACRQIATWRANGHADLTIAVNVSARQVTDGGFIKSVGRILHETRVDPSWLEFEITERLLMNDAPSTKIALEEINALGIGLSIDDFGTGYSALSYLQQFPFDILKIDRAFVGRVADDKDSAALTRAIIGMAQSLGLKVIAEGVESEAQLEFLRKYKCDLAQGYHFSRPVPADEFQALLEAASAKPKSRRATSPTEPANA
jgi:diguanylate cyclase (GGDEF)-like protein